MELDKLAKAEKKILEQIKKEKKDIATAIATKSTTIQGMMPFVD